MNPRLIPTDIMLDRIDQVLASTDEPNGGDTADTPTDHHLNLLAAARAAGQKGQ